MRDRKIIRKVFYAWDFEKEEAWLNEMAGNGWVLEKVGLLQYTFVKCQPEEYTIRVEMHGYDQSYIDFMNETKAEYIGRVFQWLYFRKKSEYGKFDIFSDIDSRIKHLERIGRMLFSIGIANLGIGVANSLSDYSNLGWINLLCATLLMYGLGRIHGKRESLEKERILCE